MRNTGDIKRYSELILLPTFKERFRYLKLSGTVGAGTFMENRWLNQLFYTDPEYRRFRRDMVIRDHGCDLGVSGYEIADRIILHHMNPIDMDDILEHSEFAWSPEYVICVSQDTHNAIHYGSEQRLPKQFAERSPYDTCPWKG